MIKKILTLISASLIFITIGCVSKEDGLIKSEIPVKLPDNAVVELKIKPYSIKITEGYTADFKVAGIDSEGKTIIISADWRLIGAESGTGTLNITKGSEVIFSAVVPGSVILEADYNNIKASAEIEVLKKRK